MPRSEMVKEIDIYRETLKMTKTFTPEELEDMSQQGRAYEFLNRRTRGRWIPFFPG